MGGKINKWDFVILFNEMYQHLEDPHNLVEQYFPNDQYMMLQNHRGVKHPFKLQDGSIDFILTEYEEFTNITSDSTLQLTLKKLPMSNAGIVSKNNHNFWKMPLKDSCFLQLHICVRPDFRQLLQPKQHFATDYGADMRIQLSSAKSDIKEICKNVKQCHSSH